MRITSYKMLLNEDLVPVLVKEKSCNYLSESRRMNNPESIVAVMKNVFDADKRVEEHIWIVAFNTRFVPIGFFEVTHGTANMSFVNNREIFNRLLLCGATSFAMVHNHPSGDSSFSDADYKTTERVKQAGELMGIEMVDHIVIGNPSYSYAKNEFI